MPRTARVSPVMANQDPENQGENAADQTQTPAEENRRAKRRKLRRILNKLLVIFGFLFIIGCFVMASFAYIFLEDCRDCPDDAPELYMAKVFRFLSAALFLVGVFMVAFSVCNYREGSGISQYGDSENLRRVSLETVACVLTGAALEKTPARLLSSCSTSTSAGTNSGNILTCPITELVDANRSNVAGPLHGERTPSLQKPKHRQLFWRYSISIPSTIDEDISHPPPSYEQALTMINKNDEQGENGLTNSRGN